MHFKAKKHFKKQLLSHYFNYFPSSETRFNITWQVNLTIQVNPPTRPELSQWKNQRFFFKKKSNLELTYWYACESTHLTDDLNLMLDQLMGQVL